MTEGIIVGIIVTVIGAAILAALGLVWRLLLRPRWQQYMCRKRTERLLKAIHDLAEGHTDAIVRSDKAAERAGISHVDKDFDSLARQLLSAGFIKQRGVGVIEHEGGFTSYSITLTGIRAVTQRRLPQ